MTTATAPDLTVPLLGGRHHFLLRRLHSLTGILFGGYLLVHLIVNATLIEAGITYQRQVDSIHSIPFLRGVEWLFIYLPIIYHAVYGLWITFTAQPNIASYPYVKNWFYVLQRASAIILAAFILFHVLAMKHFFGQTLAFVPEQATLSTVRSINASWTLAYLVYPIGVIAAAYHTANGFWTAGITWGLTTSAFGQRRWGWACAAFGLLLLVAGILSLVATWNHGALAGLPRG